MTQETYPQPLKPWMPIDGPDDEGGMRLAFQRCGISGNPVPVVLVIRPAHRESGEARWIDKNAWECGVFPSSLAYDLSKDPATNAAGNAAQSAATIGELPVLISDGERFEPRWHRAISP